MVFRLLGVFGLLPGSTEEYLPLPRKIPFPAGDISAWKCTADGRKTVKITFLLFCEFFI